MKIGNQRQGQQGFNTLLQVQQRQAEKQASAKRINSAVDDAAGLQISNRLTSTINAQQQGQRNLADGMAFARVYEQALQGVNDNLLELDRLTIAAGNGILSAQDRQALQAEANGVLANIQQGLQTEFAGNRVFNDANIGVNAGDSQLSIQTRDAGGLLAAQNVFNLDLTNPDGLSTVQSNLRLASEQITALQADTGASINSFQRAINAVSGREVATAEARSRIADLDYARASSDRAAANILTQSSLNVALQARVSAEQALSLLS